MNRDIEEIMYTLNGAMTVAQVREALEGMDDDAPVLFSCNYGDHGRTQQALPVGEIFDAETTHLRTTAYSSSGIALIKDDREPGDEPFEAPEDEEVLPVVILRQ